MTGFARGQVVVSVEHASHRVPKALGGLGLPENWLRSHHGWDPGAATVGRMLARALDAPLHLGRWTRLVADLNRSAHHRRVVPRSTGPHAISANEVDADARRARLDRYWRPYREAVEADLDRVVARWGVVLHISVHSFVERLGGQERHNHVGLLYEAWHRREKSLADRLDLRLTAEGFAVRRNFPYSGRDDGFCMRMRRERPQRRYLGMEIEMNQRIVRRADGARRLGAALVRAFGREFR